MGERRLKISDVARDTDINRGTLTRLYHETAERIDLAVLSELCRYLQCQIGDILEFQPEVSGSQHQDPT
jgi:putative transcriptional regulator